MTIQAQWGDEKFGRLSTSLKNLESFEISCGIKTEEKESTNGVKNTVVKGLDAEELNISYNSGFIVGTDPRKEIEDLIKMANKGKSNHFYLGSTNVGVGKFMINQVNLSETTHGNDGSIYSGKVNINFTQNPY